MFAHHFDVLERCYDAGVTMAEKGGKGWAWRRVEANQEFWRAHDPLTGAVMEGARWEHDFAVRWWVSWSMEVPVSCRRVRCQMETQSVVVCHWCARES